MDNFASRQLLLEVSQENLAHLLVLLLIVSMLVIFLISKINNVQQNFVALSREQTYVLLPKVVTAQKVKGSFALIVQTNQDVKIV